MGVLHFEHMGGHKKYLCVFCDTYLTNQEQFISNRFKCSSGRAILFKKVVNVEYGDPIVRKLVTGEHLVRNVFCKNCAVKVGWIYEYAWSHTELYKEGKTLLEEQMILEQADGEAGEEADN